MPSVARMHAGDDLHHGRLAGAVLADEAVDLALWQAKKSTSRSAWTPPNDFEMPTIAAAACAAVGSIVASSQVTSQIRK